LLCCSFRGAQRRIPGSGPRPRQEGQLDFSKIDTVFANAEKNGKWVELILMPGFGTPGWAMQGVPSGMFTIAYGPGHGTLLPLPVLWDQTYLARWFTFLQVIGDRYGGKASFRKIAAAGPTSVSAEMSLPDSPADIAQWQRLGYSTQRYLGAWQRTFSAYSSIFPRQYFSLALHPALPIPNGKQRAYVRQQVLGLGLEYRGQFALQADGLNAIGADQKFGYRAVRDLSGRLVTGFMMDTTATLRPEHMGAAGDPVDSLRRSIQTGLVPNDHGQVINYLEIYEPDVDNPLMQQVLHEAQQQLLKITPP
jgi:hypothetical protein